MCRVDDDMSAAFVVVFALFVLAMVGLAVTAVRWGIRRDRAAKEGAAKDRAAKVGAAKAGAAEEGSAKEGSADTAGGPREP
jgi:hypothetical protein